MTYRLVNDATIQCDYDRGCRAFVDGFSLEEWREVGSPKRVTDLFIVRRVARRRGWATGVSQGRSGARRLDFCPEHAAAGAL